MQSKLAIGFLLATCVASCFAACQLEVGGTAESWLCEDITDLSALSNIPSTAQKITIVNSKITLIPTKAFEKFGGSLIYLNITHSEVRDIQPGAFTGLSKLHHLVLDNNNIKSIKTDWIEHFDDLISLHIWHNHITEIEPSVFDHLPSLEVLDIAYNEINHCLDTEAIAKLKHLETLYLTGNPWPLRCRPPFIFHLENNHIKLVSTWGDTHVLIEECLAHEPYAKWNDDILHQCVTKLTEDSPDLISIHQRH